MPVSQGKPHFVKIRQSECSLAALLRAVIRVHNSVDDPGSDRWHQVASQRQKLYHMVRTIWSEITTEPEDNFPFCEDYVIHRMYTGYRKAADHIKTEICEYLGESR